MKKIIKTGGMYIRQMLKEIKAVNPFKVMIINRVIKDHKKDSQNQKHLTDTMART